MKETTPRPISSSETLGHKAMDWEQYFQLVKLRDSGRIEEAIRKLTRLAEETEDRVGKALATMAVAAGLRDLGRLADARCKIRETCELLSPQHEFYPRAMHQTAVLDMDEGDWNGALKRLDEILKRNTSILQMQEHKDLLEEVQRCRGIALAELRRFREARAILEPYRSEPYEKERTLYYLGACEYELGDFGAAQRDFGEILTLEPTPVYRAYAGEYLSRIFYNLGSIFYKKGQIARAKTEFEKSLACPNRDNSRDETLLKWLISASKALNQVEDAARYSEILSKLPR